MSPALPKTAIQLWKRPSALISDSSTGNESEHIKSQLLKWNRQDDSSAVASIAEQPLSQSEQPGTLGGTLAVARTIFKRRARVVAMHMDSPMLRRLFRQLDVLLSEEDWSSSDAVPTIESFETLLRMLVFIYPTRPASLGVNNAGRFFAAWLVDGSRLTIECLPNDALRWVVSAKVGAQTETAAGRTTTERLPEVISPYRPEQWFGETYKVSAGR
jgi:hypothetical protein